MRFFPVPCLTALLFLACADDPCDPQSSIPCEWLDEEDDDCTPAPALCPRSIPSSANLIVRVSQPLPKLVRVYAGPTYEDGTLVWSGTPSGTVWSLPLPLGAYSATALYVNGKDSLLAVDGNEVGYTSQEHCDGTCYGPGDAEVDLRMD